ncbi:hypothetical protein D3C76_1179470 [compost metagenome]
MLHVETSSGLLLQVRVGLNQFKLQVIILKRPMPLADVLESPFLILKPAPEVWEWIQREILADPRSIHNPEHAHLIDANIDVLWASTGFGKEGRVILGQAEQNLINVLWAGRGSSRRQEVCCLGRMIFSR